MVKVILSCSWFLVCLVAILAFPYALQAQEIQLSGRVIDVDSLQPLPSVHIFRQSDSLGTVSNENGYFSLTLSIKDSLIFSAVNYERRVLALPDSLQQGRPYWQVALKSRTILLKEVVVNAYLNPAAVRRYLDNVDRLKKGQKKTDLDRYKPAIKGRTGTERANTVGLGTSSNPNGGAAIEGALTGLANLFNKRAKQQKQIKQLLEAEKMAEAAQAYDDFIKSKFNEQVIQEATGLKGEALSHFIAYCQLSDTFVYQASEYELLVAILKKLDSFKKLR